MSGNLKNQHKLMQHKDNYEELNKRLRQNQE